MRRISAWVLWAAGLGLLAYGAGVTEEGVWGRLSLSLGGAAFGVVGLILTTNTRYVTGWLFLTIQGSIAAMLVDLGTSGTELVLLIAAVLLTFPAGRLPSPRWRWAAWALGLAAVMWLLFDVLKLAEAGEDYAWLVFMAVVVPVMGLSAVRIVNDYRAAEGDTRQQLKWLAWVLLIGGAILLISLIPIAYIDDANELAGLVLLVGSPVAIGLAITKCHLYDIDRIISRTVSYALVVGLLALFVAIVSTVVGTRFEDPLVVAATTLAVAALFNPVRTRVQRRVDRRFNRSRYDAERVLTQFGTTLRDQLDAAELVEGWLGVVSKTMHPSKAGVWVRELSRNDFGTIGR